MFLKLKKLKFPSFTFETVSVFWCFIMFTKLVYTFCIPLYDSQINLLVLRFLWKKVMYYEFLIRTKQLFIMFPICYLKEYNSPRNKQSYYLLYYIIILLLYMLTCIHTYSTQNVFNIMILKNDVIGSYLH